MKKTQKKRKLNPDLITSSVFTGFALLPMPLGFQSNRGVRTPSLWSLSMFGLKFMSCIFKWPLWFAALHQISWAAESFRALAFVCFFAVVVGERLRWRRDIDSEKKKVCNELMVARSHSARTLFGQLIHLFRAD